ncbi:WYL domain-containing protein [Methylibium sp.]|uniref:WYL domain-containing protein n=1 Tax=Methylibium sp. TaxID=2067992 RepID=UPI001811C076|nr:WYL domain-containing protein [Methylibium sp.]MBA3589517.1 WYL domain-containing protein [Methylibium sp.]
MREKGHDTLVRRLALMLLKLDQGDSLDPHKLAGEFGVNLRTIQRDLNERFAYLPLNKVEGRYRLDSAFLGKFDNKDIERFASLAGIRGLFPSLSDDFLRDIFDTRMQAALLVKGHHYEDLAGKETVFKNLEHAILERRKVSFRYTRRIEQKSYENIEPYKLLNHKGIWYLAGKDGTKLKTFSFARIESLIDTGITFNPDPAIESTIVEEEGIWFGDESIEFVLEVDREVASYFKRRSVIANQVIVKELQDGGLIVSARVGHPNQVVPHVRYWIPHVRIISPHDMQRRFYQELTAYIESRSTGEMSNERRTEWR